MHRLKPLTVALFALALGVSSPGARAAATPTEPPIRADPDNIRVHVELLTGDALRGRATGQGGSDMAADYIAKQFARYGLHPSGDNASYFQNIRLVDVETLDETSLTVAALNLQTLTLRNLEDFVAHDETQTESVAIDAPIVFAGFGINAAEYGRDDYKNVSLNGKVVLLFAGGPEAADAGYSQGKARAYYGGWAYKFAETARRGALATLIIERAGPAAESWQAVRDAWGTHRAYPPRDAAARLQAAGWIRAEAAKKLAVLADADLDKLLAQAQSKDFRPSELPLRLQGHIASRMRPFVSRNVLAVLPGRGAASEEAVLYTAHFPREAAGCALLLEVARAWSRTPSMPPRMIVFAALTAEDEGLLGSEYLTKHSPVPPGKISLALNYDGPAAIGGPKEVVVSGAERTTFYPVVAEQAQSLGLTVQPDAPPATGSFYRSSALSLARAGIPSVSITESRARPADKSFAGTEFTRAAELATLGYQLGLRAAFQPELIDWLYGDEIRAEREGSQLPEELNRKAPQRKMKGRK